MKNCHTRLLVLLLYPISAWCQVSAYSDANNANEAVGIIYSQKVYAEVYQAECITRNQNLESEINRNLKQWEEKESKIINFAEKSWIAFAKAYPEYKDSPQTINRMAKLSLDELAKIPGNKGKEVINEHCRTHFSDLASGVWRSSRTPKAYQFLDEAVSGADIENDWRRLYQRSRELFLKKQYDEAIDTLRTALTLVKKSPAIAARLEPRTLLVLSFYLRDQGKYSESEQTVKQAIKIYESAPPPISPEISSAQAGLGKLYYMQGRFTEAEPQLRRALKVLSDAGSGNDPNVPFILEMLANITSRDGRTKESKELFDLAAEFKKYNLQKGTPSKP